MADALSVEIQQALQQAVGDANNAAPVTKNKKNKKRFRDASQPGDDQARAKRKKKQHAVGDEVTPEPALSSTAEVDEAASGIRLLGEKDRKKKGGKDKGTLPAEDVLVAAQTEQQAQAVLDADLDASTADFLSAVVAAASATSQMQEYQHTMSQYLTYPDHYPSYPPSQYPYLSPAPHFGQAPHAVPMFPDLHGLSLPELSLTSSEDLLRTLQDLDITKIASVLKSLGDAAAAAANAPTPRLNIDPSFIPAPPPPGPPSVQQVSAKSDAILGRPPKQVKESGQSTRSLVPRVHMPLPPSPEEGNPDHAHMLANVWMNAGKLAEMVKYHGLVYKKGKFSALEDTQLETAIENYRMAKGLTEDDLVDVIFTREKGRGDAFWSEITSALHLRPIIAVYHHVRRLWHPMRAQGKWVTREDDELRKAVADHGQQWEKVSLKVGRMASDCRDRYRNHIQGSEVRHTGTWTKEEEIELTRIVSELTIQQGKDIDNDIFWGVVSQRMGGRRGRQQCRIKWTDSLSTQLKNDGSKPRWSQLDAYILVHKFVVTGLTYGIKLMSLTELIRFT
ncbi:hypothetical protein EW026_g649 [Hermanssonia centrifuga]|uniref:Uncharacterized protein n=1 Tax=Hermanssonia centrifuga TaxID=98765 RepID=A0A4S4KYJ1_9APHY|nr:hypothetical protein EW026_g649 [Hermanssonia centrifuga]